MRSQILDIAARLGDYLVAFALALLVLLPALATATHPDDRSTAVLPPLAPATAVDASAQQDAEAEGTDVLMVDWAASPTDLWDALVPHAEWYDDGGTGGYGTYYVPTGSEVIGITGTFMATHGGWLHYPFNVATGGRSEPVELHVPYAPADHGDACAIAAGLLLDTARTWTTRIYEDLSYAGMSPVEAQCNDELADGYWSQEGATLPGMGPLRNADLVEYLTQRMVPVPADPTHV